MFNKIARVLTHLAMAILFSCKGSPYTFECTQYSDCFDNYACASISTTTGTGANEQVETLRICMRACTEANAESTCLENQICDVPTNETSGVCRDIVGDFDGGDPGP